LAKTRPIKFLEDIACQFIEQSLMNSGLDRTTAKALSKSACKNLVAPVGDLVDKPVQKIKTRRKTKSDSKQSKALKMANQKLRNKNGKLKKGKTQSDIMKMAQRLRRKM
tara:strand:+ start:88 stop:414 length:327 start_codon:yes stop_codon:yes gene_type:complete